MRPIVVYFGGFALPNRNAAAHRAISNAKLLGLMGVDTRVIGFEPAIEPKARRMAPSRNGIGLLSLPSKSSSIPVVSSFRVNPIPAIRYLRRLARRRKIAAVVCYNFPSVAQAGIQAFCRLNGIRYISDVTEWNAEGGRTALHTWLRRADNALRIRCLNWMSDGLITTSPIMTEYYAKFGSNTGELPTLFDKASLATQVNTPQPPNSPVRVIFVGPGFDVQMSKVGPDQLKERIDLIIRLAVSAIGTGWDFHLDLFGLTQDQFALHFAEDAQSADRYRDRIAFHGRVTHDTILAATRRADFSILLRDNKHANNVGFPTKFAESLMCGTPVIIDEIKSITAHHGHPHVLLLKRDEPAKMASTLIGLIRAYRERELLAPSPPSSFQTFDYPGFRAEMAKALGW